MLQQCCPPQCCRVVTANPRTTDALPPPTPCLPPPHYSNAITQGWDKTYCLQYLLKDGFSDIHFYGDKTFEGGNDFEIFSSDLTHGHTTSGPEDTMKQCTELFL